MKNYKNIIFDLGGVVLDIDYTRTMNAFRDLGIKNAAELYSKAKQNPIFDDLEKGNISEKDFYNEIRKMSEKEITDDQIRSAWNAILIGLPLKNVRLLSELKKSHRLFLLSNTNCIHEAGYRKMITDEYGSFIFDQLFEKIYLSHELHMRKPDPEIFEYVLKDAGLKTEETFFIDDSPQHVQTALNLKIPAVHLKNETLVDFWERFTKEFQANA